MMEGGARAIKKIDRRSQSVPQELQHEDYMSNRWTKGRLIGDRAEKTKSELSRRPSPSGYEHLPLAEIRRPESPLFVDRC